MKIVLVDDNPDHRELMEARMRRAFAGAEFVHIVRQTDLDRALSDGHIDLVLTDFHLLWTDGLQVLRQVQDKHPDTPVIMVTDTGGEEIAAEGMRAGLADYVLKGHMHRLPISARESLEKARLRRQHSELLERYRIISELSSDYGYGFRVEPGGAFVREWVTPAFTRITGYTLDELETGILLPLAHPEDRATVEHGRDVLRSGQPYTCELRILTRGGEVRWLRDSARPVRDPATGRVARVVGDGRDITADRLAERHREELMREQALRAAAEAGEEYYRSLAEAIPQMVFSTLPDSSIDYVNKRWLEYTGLSPEGGLTSFRKVLHPGDVDAAAEQWQACARTGATMEGEYRIRRASDGAYRWQLVRAVPLHDSSGRIVKWFGTWTDIDDQKRAQQALREAQKLESIGLLAGGIAHDFNNLLTGILGNTSLALEELPEGSGVRSYLEHAIHASERAADLTRQLLAYSGRGRLFVQPLNVSGVLRDITSLLETSLPKKVHLQLDLPPNLPPVEMDATQIQQVIMNMVINGAEAIGEDRPGTVRVAARLETLTEKALSGRDFVTNGIGPGTYVCLEVEDDGCGMEEDVKAHIFDPFFTTKFTGRGLGMAAALGIVRGHKGAIEVESAPGKGTRFRILLPVSERSVAAPAAEPEPEPESVRGSGTIMVVDDEETIRRTAKMILERFGYRVVLAGNGREAVEKFRFAPDSVDVILLDMTMPVMSGEEALVELKRIRPAVPVIASSGYSESMAMSHFAGQDVAGFIQKPYTPARLAGKIRRVTERAARTA